MSSARRYFISCATAEFGSYRNALRGLLTSESADVKIQEEFIVGAGTLLEKLDDYIGKASAVLHLVGKWAGSRPQPADIRNVLGRYPDFATVLPELADWLDPESCPFTYSQWEAYLAIYHRVPCFIYIADDESVREEDWTEDPAQTAQQEQHVQRLKTLGRDRATFSFVDAKDVALSFFRSLQDELSGATFGRATSVGTTVTWPEVTPPAACQLADRETEVELFSRLISGNSKERILLLHGPSDRGKSSLLNEFETLARGVNQLRCARGDFKNGQSLRDVLFILTQQLPGVRFVRHERALERNAVEAIRIAFLQDISEAQYPVILILDTYEDATDEVRLWVEQQLFELVRRFEGLRIVVAGQKIPDHRAKSWQNLVINRELPPITDPIHWCRYARETLHLTQTPDDHIETLVKAVLGSPRPLGTMLGNLRDGGV